MITNLFYSYGVVDPYFFLAIFGVLLIILEAFLPGGVVGAAGTVILILAVMLITDTVAGFVMVLFGFIVFTALCIYLIFKMVPRDKLRSSLFLFSALSKEEGYNSVKDMSRYMGCVGKTVSIMRPVGKIQLGSDVLDAIALNNFIDEGKIVEVVEVQTSKIFVKEREV